MRLPPRPHPVRRLLAHARLVARWTALIPLLPVVGTAAPDLCVPRDGITFDGDRVRVVVRNLGEDRSPPAGLLLADGPLLGGPAGRLSAYRPVQGLAAVWIDHAPAPSGDAIDVTVHFTRGRHPHRSTGRLATSAGTVLAADGGEARWDFEVPAKGDSLRFRVTPASAAVLEVTLESEPVPIASSAGWSQDGREEVPLSNVRVPAQTRRLEVPALDPGGSAELEAVLAGATEALAFVDPDDRLAELREGNNAASRRRDPDAPILAALHVHSCLSEGPGSFDWQAHHASLAGYELVWWTEHDWRVSCFDHLESFGFEEGEDIRIQVVRPPGAEPSWETADVFAGDRSLRVLTGEIVRVVGRRDRFAYSLASEVTVDLAAFIEGGQTVGLSVVFVLSRHPGEQRELVYELVPSDRAGDGAVRLDGGAAHLRVPVEPGSWKAVSLPVSRDAARAWTNGKDNNLLAVQLECPPDAGGARVDAFAIRHNRCGAALTAVQREWTGAYPNLRHEIGGEISYRRPHLARYGGPDELLDLDSAWDVANKAGEGEAEIVIRRVHESGGIVSWCHPFGSSRTERHPGLFGPRYWDYVIGLGLGGADLLEVGYRDRAGYRLPDYLERWDLTSEAGIPVTGVGVNDSHHIQWGPGENDFATWIRVGRGREADRVIDTLAAGHVFFGDPLAFRGVLEIRCGGSGRWRHRGGRRTASHSRAHHGSASGRGTAHHRGWRTGGRRASGR